MQKKAAVVLLLISCALLVGGSSIDDSNVPHQRSKRDMSAGDRQYLIELYNTFNTVFQQGYKQNEQSKQFSVATINKPDIPQELRPCPLVMNEHLGDLSPQNNNYLAYTPIPSPTRPNGQIHAETQIVNGFPLVTQGVGVHSVYLVTHSSPCKYCTGILRKLIEKYPNVHFYIGYVEAYQNEQNENYFIQQIGGLPNADLAKISPHLYAFFQKRFGKRKPVKCSIKKKGRR